MENQIKNLSDEGLVKSISELNTQEHEAMLNLLLHLIEFEARKLFIPLGYPSLFSYCVEKLRYSEPAAGRRIAAARCIRDFPEVYELLSKKELTLTTISIVASALTQDNKAEVLEKIRGKVRSVVETLASSLKPAKKVMPERIKPIFVEQQEAPNQLPLAEAPKEELPVEERYKLSFSVSKAFMRKLNTLKALGGEKPLEVLFEELLDAKLERVDPRKRAERRQKKPPGGPTSVSAVLKPATRHIPAAVRDAVLIRDKFQCTFVSLEGKRCTACQHLEIDHIVPFGKGGLSSMDNLRVLCRGHNRFMAEIVYGKEFINSFSNSAGGVP